jgi:UDPglucose 6-dehydrogenase
MSRVCVVGTGYVGLVTAVCLADRGHTVVGLDIDAAKIAALAAGHVPLHEPGLPALLNAAQAADRLTFTTRYADAIPAAEIIILAVDTPSGSAGQADLDALRAAVAALAPHLTAGAIVVNKSTVPIGTGDLVELLLRRHTSVPCRVVSNPEFLREGSAVADFQQPDRIILGARDATAAESVAALYAPLACPVVVTDIRTAEMIKYAANSYLAARISFINEIAAVCERLDADVAAVARGMGLDRRIGPHFLEAGLGWGGSCFPKDVQALIHMAAAAGAHPQLLRAVAEINRDQRLVVVQKLQAVLGSLEGRTVAVLGLAFKPHTDDLRQAPALELIGLLQAAGCAVRAYDPVAGPKARALLGERVVVCDDLYAAANGADGVVIATAWPEVVGLELARLRAVLRVPLLVDGRNCLEPSVVRAAGFVYAGVGRGAPVLDLPADSNAVRPDTGAVLAGTAWRNAGA